MPNSPPAGPMPPSGDPTPEERLARRIHLICLRVVRGQGARQTWQVRLQMTLRICSIILSSLGSAGVIADRVIGNIPGQTGWAFIGAMIVLAFGILMQVANEFRVEQDAIDARSLADSCELYATQLGIILEAEDPSHVISQLHDQVNASIVKYHRVLPEMTADFETRAEQLANKLNDDNRRFWRLPRGNRTRRTPPSP